MRTSTLETAAFGCSCEELLYNDQYKSRGRPGVKLNFCNIDIQIHWN